MKKAKIFALLTLIFFSITSAIGQENATHLKFKGVPIDGTLKKFVSRMESAGFNTVSSRNGEVILVGDFAGFKNCNIYVATLDNNDLVSYITVVFPPQDTWEYLNKNYTSLKELLTEKYGNPTSVTEKFQNSYIDDDNDRMHAVKFDRCKYETRFNTDKGEIVLWIDHESVMRCFVALQYKDKINGNIIKNQAKEDL